jgi:hypothetical protein
MVAGSRHPQQLDGFQSRNLIFRFGFSFHMFHFVYLSFHLTDIFNVIIVECFVPTCWLLLIEIPFLFILLERGATDSDWNTNQVDALSRNGQFLRRNYIQFSAKKRYCCIVYSYKQASVLSLFCIMKNHQ